uniref:NADH-ubiquinone oxidoreductase chain 2 n=3 Tax=Cichlidae TaxID=8113 RepID=A0A343TEJ1_9CICH|nr:NADH dehydrogenase subunit 2 [Oreochromis macrochir]AUW55191.1 NADH dehydrogenase subunit 2 [Oreochromis macrochir]
MNPYILAILLFGLGLGTTITFASSHWLLAWMGLEMNTLAIIPLMAQHHHPRAVEATTKYFLTQAAAAATLLFASITNAWLTGQWEIQQITHPLPTTMITLALALKIGLAPLHAWLPEVLQGTGTLLQALILSTWQKLAPSPLNSSNPAFKTQTPFIILGLGIHRLLEAEEDKRKHNSVKFVAYSSIAHLGWMILVLQFSPSITLLTLLTYLIMTSSTFLVFKLNKSTNINTLATSWAKAPALTALTPLILLSLGGLPPLTGFMPKWLILQELTKQGLAPTATLAALSALLSLYFYLRLSYAMTLTISPNSLLGTTPWRLPSTQLTYPLATSTTLTICLLPLTPAISALLTP